MNDMPDRTSAELGALPAGAGPDEPGEWSPPGPGVQRTSYLPLPELAPPPPGPLSYGSRRSRRRGPLLLAVGCLLAGLVLGLVAAVQYRSERSPQSAVRRYFAALARGDAAGALGFAAVPPRGPYLTDAVLRQQLRAAALTGLRVRGARVHGGTGTVTVSYRLGSGNGATSVTDTVPVVRRGSSWRLGQVATELAVVVPVNGADRLTFAGGGLPHGYVTLFPGALPIATDSTAVRIGSQPSVRLADGRPQVEVRPMLAPAAEGDLQQALDRALAQCLTGRSKQAGCPPPGDPRPLPGSLRGTVLPEHRPATIELADGGKVTLTGSVTVRGSWQDWDFNNQAVRRTGQTTVELDAQASLADLSTVYWTAR